jgi:hypothetical protein
MGRAYRIKMPLTTFGKKTIKMLIEDLVRGRYKQIERITELNLPKGKFVVLEVI